jgi:hypothetical protein
MTTISPSVSSGEHAVRSFAARRHDRRSCDGSGRRRSGGNVDHKRRELGGRGLEARHGSSEETVDRDAG